MEQNWKKKKIKIGKDRGDAYFTYRGEAKVPKKIQPITCFCVFNCRRKVTETDRKRIFESFYALGSHDEQNKYLYGLIEKKEIRRRRTQKSFKRHSFVYNVRLNNGNRVEVCKKTFCDLHAVGKRRVEIIAAKILSGIILSGDERGRHHNRPKKVPEEAKEKVREHIKSFPQRKSHYSQKDNRKRKYLSENLSISRMYDLYLEKYEPQVSETAAKPQVKEWLYRKIFNEEFNLSFGYPRSDTCEKCDLLHVAIQNASDEQREEHQEELAEHQEKASQGYSSLKKDTDTTKLRTNHQLITFDLMQNLPVPTLTHSSMFYSRQLWVYNFGIHNATSHSASMYMWDETVASRGADEICSCLQTYIDTLPADIQQLTCYSDSCFGQNKNFQIICFWNLQVQKRLKQVDHKYLVRGHTYLPNDRDFSHIEKRKGSATVYVPEGWKKIVKEACPKKPYDVHTMDSSLFRDFTGIVKQHTQRKKDTDKHPVLISKATWMNFGQTVDTSGKVQYHPNEVWLRYSYSATEQWSKLNLLKGRKKLQPSYDVNLPLKYPDGHQIKRKKVQDLKRMIPFLPAEHRQFYMDLDSGDSDVTDSEMDD